MARAITAARESDFERAISHLEAAQKDIDSVVSVHPVYTQGS